MIYGKIKVDSFLINKPISYSLMINLAFTCCLIELKLFWTS